MLNYNKPRFTTWLKMSMDDKTELVLLNYYKTEEHELRLYVCKVPTNEFLHKNHFILWDNDEAYYYSDHVIARQAFESMSKLYYHAENYKEKPGEWTHTHIGDCWEYQCSDCLKYHCVDSKYCPNCGKR